MTYAQQNNNNNNNAGGMHLKEEVEIFLSCRDLLGKDRNSKSDPFVVVYMKQKKSFVEIGRTETVIDNHFPSFSKQFKLDYLFEEEQLLRFDVYDEDRANSKKLKDHDFIGSCAMVLGEIVHEKGQIASKKLLNKGKPVRNKKTNHFASLICTLEKTNTSNTQILTFALSANNLPKMDMFGKSDGYFVLNRVREDGKSVSVYQSEVVKKNLNPVWKAFSISSQKLCNNDAYRPVHLCVYDWDKNGEHDFIGKCETNLNELNAKPTNLTLRRPGKQKTYGCVKVTRAESRVSASFLDYIQGGQTEISLMVAIDFTGSNGHPRDTASLHHIYGKQPSQYQHAIRQICNIVSVYDADQKFPVWGFGAHFASIDAVIHDFNLNFHPSNPEVNGVYGIEQTYLNGITSNQFNLSGPTLFAPILTKAKEIASGIHLTNVNNSSNSSSGRKLQYFILLILTDGIINDMKQTKNEIVKIANQNLPLSILIVGVGDADFSKMDELDGDEQGLMNSSGQYSKRDVVQFVPMNKYLRNMNQLNRDTLKEIPKQFLSYTKAHNISPAPPISKQQALANYNAKKFQMSQNEANANVAGVSEAMNNNNSNNASSAVAEQYANAPLPPQWERAYDESGTAYYVNHSDGTTQWNHPMAMAMAMATQTS